MLANFLQGPGKPSIASMHQAHVVSPGKVRTPVLEFTRLLQGYLKMYPQIAPQLEQRRWTNTNPSALISSAGKFNIWKQVCLK